MNEQIDFTIVLNNLHDNIKKKLGNKTSHDDCLKLKKILDDLVYSQEDESKLNATIEAINKKVEKFYGAKIEQGLKPVRSSRYTGWQNWEDLRKEFIEYKEEYDFLFNKRQMQKKKLIEKLEELKTKISNTNGRPIDTIKRYEQLIESIRNIEKKDTQYISWDDLGPYQTRSIKSALRLYDFINKTNAIATVGGKALEYLLEGIGTKVDEISDEVISGIIERIDKTQGEKTEKQEENFIDLKDFGLEMKKTSFDPYSSRQGKMDVKLVINLPEEEKKTEFKISAKNWSTVLDHDFGEVNIAYGLMRSLQSSQVVTALVNFFATTEKNQINENNLNNVHKIAKLSLAADILMGYSQESNFIDTIVINDRKNNHFIVFPVSDIMDGLKEADQKTIYLTNYDNGMSVIRKVPIAQNLLALKAQEVILPYQTISNYIANDLADRPIKLT